ncbi:MAG: bifunctional 3-deoxy-7-phosphoheptulonate synthase/chorismate mutase type II [Bacteroidales bacterium]
MEVQLDLQPFELPGQSGAQNPFLIAGPCSAESEQQVLETASALKQEGIHLFRAGIWKPRTRPGGFQGLGSAALPWLRTVKDLTGLAVATEVANERHVYEALKYDIDVLWIGARTTANPFAVEEIANALKGKDIPVMVKNPVNPDLKLWLGAIERLNMQGIKQLAAIHRGFSSYSKSSYRNPPQWNIPKQLKKIAPELPVFNDPSHITGNNALLYEIAKDAMNKKFDGLMIEVHPNPPKALSDSNQQITPAKFHELLYHLSLNNAQFTNLPEIEQLRKYIDNLDEELLEIIDKRMKLTGEIGSYKKQREISVLQENRWKELLETRIKNGQKKGLDQKFIKKIFETIHSESITKQKTIKNNDSKRVYSKFTTNNKLI